MGSTFVVDKQENKNNAMSPQKCDNVILQCLGKSQETKTFLVKDPKRRFERLFRTLVQAYPREVLLVEQSQPGHVPASCGVPHQEHLGGERTLN